MNPIERDPNNINNTISQLREKLFLDKNLQQRPKSIGFNNISKSDHFLGY